MLPLQVPQNVLNPLVAGGRPSQSHGGNSLVGDAVGLGVGIILGNPAAVEQAGLPLVSKLGVNPFSKR